ncbi:hypothetical protein PVK06_009221 [Gossypium arboreum]|uniref:Uncharacterized protein n=1 Tax=Gossypium arboreum TaxID=29729 RepID=A0ABR0QLV3_GOSAR|nr:hypothetical protein PVK06_009221 [Gossypium arboreum]
MRNNRYFKPHFQDPLKAEFSAKQCGNERVSPSLNDATPTTEEGSPATKPRAIPAVSDAWSVVTKAEGHAWGVVAKAVRHVWGVVAKTEGYAAAEGLGT